MVSVDVKHHVYFTSYIAMMSEAITESYPQPQCTLTSAFVYLFILLQTNGPSRTQDLESRDFSDDVILAALVLGVVGCVGVVCLSIIVVCLVSRLRKVGSVSALVVFVSPSSSSS